MAEGWEEQFTIKKPRGKLKTGLNVLAYAIPILILIFTAYIYFLPLGYSTQSSITIEQGIVKASSSFFLQDLKGKQVTNLANNSLNGMINAVYVPRVKLNNAYINVSIESEGVYLGYPISFNSSDYNWSYNFDFSNNLSGLKGNAIYNKEKECAYFSNTSLYLANSSDKFESAFSVYAKWGPESNNSFQQIVGHYNWELLQDSNSIRLQIGRVNAPNQTLKNLLGKMYTISYPITSEFFNKTHEALAIYNPGNYIELWVDGNLGGRIILNNDTIWKDYNTNRDLSLGKSGHGVAQYYQGCIYDMKFFEGVINPGYVQESSFSSSEQTLLIPLFGSGDLSSINLEVKQ